MDQGAERKVSCILRIGFYIRRLPGSRHILAVAQMNERTRIFIPFHPPAAHVVGCVSHIVELEGTPDMKIVPETETAVSAVIIR